ncbi:unnamed protein product [Phytophthora fragariaefolia]|uniref:Unnamed protein product n=1 Tax=Phytophthora fragariaefolia TaxID=1490495 RepID=A0A9W7DAR9_9STRA|nr:unnamed protein product [Phytophthora fragariaefolia]
MAGEAGTPASAPTSQVQRTGVVAETPAESAVDGEAPAESDVVAETPAELGVDTKVPAELGVDAGTPTELETKPAISAESSAEVEDVAGVAVSSKSTGEPDVAMTLSAGSGIGATVATELDGEWVVVMEEAEVATPVESEVMPEAATTLGTEAGTPAEIGVVAMNPAKLAAGVVDTATDRDATFIAEPAGIETEVWTGEADSGAVAAEFEIAGPVVNSHGDEPPTTAGSKVGAAETTVVTAVLEVVATGPEVAVVMLESSEPGTETSPSGEAEAKASSVKWSNSTSSAGLPASKSGKPSSLAGLAGIETTVVDRDPTERREERGRRRLEERVDMRNNSPSDTAPKSSPVSRSITSS